MLYKYPITIFILCSSSYLSAQNQFEWAVYNTSTQAGERVIAIIDTGTISTWDGIKIVGEIIEESGRADLISHSTKQKKLRHGNQKFPN